MKNIFLKTNNSYTGLVLRFAISIVFLPHGLQKTLGWFGGLGFAQTMNVFTEKLHLPWTVAFLVILVEFLGVTCFIIGFASRFWAIAFVGLMLGIMITTHLENGFFMNWFGTQKGEGCQFDILTIGIALAIIMEGSGKFSFDEVISEKIKLSGS